MRSSLIRRGLATVLSVAVLSTGLVASLPQQAWSFSPSVAATANPAPDQTASSSGKLPEPDLSGIVKEDAGTADPVIPVAPAPVRIVKEDGSESLAPEPKPAPSDFEKKPSAKQAAAKKNAQDHPDDPKALQEAAAADAEQAPKVDLPAGVYDANAPENDPNVREIVNPKLPADRSTSQGLTPTLTGEIINPKADTAYQFRYLVCSEQNFAWFSSPCPEDKAVADSGWSPANSWAVPAGKLKADATYFWVVLAKSSAGDVASSGQGGSYFATGPTLATGLPAWAKGTSPKTGVSVQNASPTLESVVQDGAPGQGYEFNFQVELGDKAIWNSGWLKDPKVTVPDKQLYWNTNYTWSTALRKAGTTIDSKYFASGSFQVAVPEQNGTAAWASEGTSQTVRGVNLGSGGYSTASTDAKLQLGASSFDLARLYRSGNTVSGPFGLGWSTALGMKVRQAQGVLSTFVAMPTGREYAFATNPDGTFAPSLSNASSILTKNKATNDWSIRESDGTAYTFDDAGLKSMSNPYGALLKIDRDSNGHPSLLRDDYSNRTLTLTWSGNHVTSIEAGPKVEGANVRWDYTYTEDSLTKVCAPGSGTSQNCTTYNYQGGGSQARIVDIIAPSGRSLSKIDYTADGKVVTIVDPATGTTEFAWSKNGDNAQIVIKAPESSDAGIYLVDNAGRTTKFTNALGGESSWTYDSSGRLASTKTPEGGRTDYKYNAKNRLEKKKVWRSNDTVTYLYTYYATNAKLNDDVLWKQDDPSGSIRQVVDDFGRITERETSCGFWCSSRSITKYAYTDGSEASTDGAKVPVNLLKSETNPLGGVTTYGYDKTGQLTTKTAPSGLVTSYTYDGLGRLTAVKEAGDGVSTGQAFQLDSSGAVAAATSDEDKDDVTGLTRQLKTATTRNADGLVESSVVTDTKSGRTLTTSFAFDNAGRVNKVTGPNNVVQNTSTYTNSGLIASSGSPNRSDQLFTYDAAGNQLTSVIKNYQDPVSGRNGDITVQQTSYDTASRPVTRTDARGQVWKTSYSADGYVTKVTAVGRNGASDRVKEENTLDRYGNPVKQRLWDGAREVVTGFDEVRRPNQTSVAVPASNGSPAYSLAQMTIYDGMGNLSSNLRNIPNAVDYGSSEAYWSRNEIDAVGRTTATRQYVLEPAKTKDDYPKYVEKSAQYFAFDSRGRQIQTTDGRGSKVGEGAFTSESSYSASGLLLSVKRPETKVAGQVVRPVTSYGYDSLGRSTVVVGPDGSKTTKDLDDLGRVTKTTLPAVRLDSAFLRSPFQSVTYNDAGDVLTKTNAGGQSSAFTYDSLGHPVQQVDSGASPSAAQRVTKTSYRADGLADTGVDPSGVQTSYGYDDLGRKLSQTQTAAGGEARTTKYGYDTPGNLISTTLPNGAVTTSSYDVLGQMTAQTDPDGVKRTFAYDSRGNRTRTSDGLGQVTLQAYDYASRPVSTSVQNTQGTVVSRTDKTYDLAGNLTWNTGPLGTGVKQEWDGANRLLSSTDANGGKTLLQYDVRGNTVSVTDPASNTTNYEYNVLGWRTKEVLPPATPGQWVGDRSRYWGYDINGWLTKTTEPGGVSTTQSYDLDGNMTRQDGTGAEASTTSRVLSYDALGRLATASHPSGTQLFSYDGWGNRTGSKGPAGDSTATFDAVGQLTNRTDAAGSVSFDWSPGGRLTSMKNNNQLSSTFAYDAAGLLANRTNGGGTAAATTSSYAHDATGRVTGEKVTAGSNTIYDWQGTYDAASRLIESKQNTAGVAAQGSTQYSYDAGSRVTGWKDPAGVANQISYDSAGNITSLAGVNRTYDAQNRILTNGDKSLTWSPRGTLASQTTPAKGDVPAKTSTYSFDAFGEFISDGSVTNSYDGLERLAKSGDTAFTYSGVNRSPSTAGAAGWLRSPSGSAWATSTGSYLVSNSRGDVLASITGAGVNSSTSYTPYGTNTTTGKPGAGIGYQGSWTANSGLVNMDARWYSPEIAGFISRDDADVPLNQINRYAYVAGNPVNNTDPTGHTIAPPIPGIDWALWEAQMASGGGSGLSIGGFIWPIAAAVGAAGLGYLVGSYLGGQVAGPMSNMGQIAGNILSGWNPNWNSSWDSSVPYRAPGKSGSAPNWNPWSNGKGPWSGGLNLGSWATGLDSSFSGVMSGYAATMSSWASGMSGFANGMAAWSNKMEGFLQAATAFNQNMTAWNNSMKGWADGMKKWADGMSDWADGMKGWSNSMSGFADNMSRLFTLGPSDRVLSSQPNAAGGPLGPTATPGPNLEHPRIDPPRIATQKLPVDPAPAAAGPGKPPACVPGDNGGGSGGDDLGVIYYRTDLSGNLAPYVGQSKDENRFTDRQGEHASDHPDSEFRFEVLDRAKPGTALDKVEEDYIRGCGGPTNKSNPNGSLSNKRFQMNDNRYQENGGVVPKPNSK